MEIGDMGGPGGGKARQKPAGMGLAGFTGILRRGEGHIAGVVWR